MGTDEVHRKSCHRWNTPWHAHELTFSCYRRRPFLSADRTRMLFVSAVDQARARLGFHVWAYVIMPEHVHLLVWPGKEDYSISQILKSIKQSVARRAIGWIRANRPTSLRLFETGQPTKPYQFWQDGGGYDTNIRTAEALRNKITYVHRNPVARDLVTQMQEWKWSSARDWAGVGPGPLRIDMESCLETLA